MERHQSGLHHNYGTVHHNPKVNSSQRHQVGRNAKRFHAAQGKQKGQGNNAGNYQGRSPVAQHQEEEQSHHQGPFQQILLYRSQGSAHQVRSVQVGGNPNARRQRRLDLGHPRVNGMGYLVAVPSLEHQANASDGLAFSVARQGTVPGSMSVPNRGQIPQGQRQTSVGRKGNLPDIVQIFVQAFQPNVPRLFVLLNVGPSCILVAFGNGVEYIHQG